MHARRAIYVPSILLYPPLEKPPKQTKINPKAFLAEHTMYHQSKKFPLQNKCDMSDA